MAKRAESSSDESSNIFDATFRHFFQGVMQMSACFCEKLKSFPTYLSSKNKKIRERVDPRVQLVWRLRVKVSCHSPFLNPHSTILILQSPFYNPHSTIPILQSPFYYPHSTIPILQFPFNDPHSTIPILRSPFYNPHTTIPILQSPFYNPHSTIPIPQSLFSYSCFQ